MGNLQTYETKPLQDFSFARVADTAKVEPGHTRSSIKIKQKTQKTKIRSLNPGLLGLSARLKRLNTPNVNQALGKSIVSKESHCDLQSVDLLETTASQEIGSIHH